MSPLAAYVAGLSYPVRPIGEKDVENVAEPDVENVFEQEGVSARNAVGQLRMMLGLLADASHTQVVDAVQDLKIGDQAWTRVVAVLDMTTASVEDVVDRVAAMLARDQRAEQEMRAPAPRLQELETLLGVVRDALRLDNAVLPGQVLEAVRGLEVRSVQAEQLLTRERTAMAEVREVLQLREHVIGHRELIGYLRQMCTERTRAEQAMQRLSGIVGPDVSPYWDELLDAVDLLATPVTEVMSMEEVERQRTARQEALHTVMDLWQQHRLGEDPAMDDLVAAAQWLATGDTSAVERIHQPLPIMDAVSSDQARWSPEEGR